MALTSNEDERNQDLTNAAITNWVDRILAGEVRALARAISTIDDGNADSIALL
jgi:putative protein kinase ArgK-like GTPase of G3E family